ncbi:MAG: rpa-associated protein, partial [Solirubrobacteraceae bacterium]
AAEQPDLDQADSDRVDTEAIELPSAGDESVVEPDGESEPEADRYFSEPDDAEAHDTDTEAHDTGADDTKADDTKIDVPPVADETD